MKFTVRLNLFLVFFWRLSCHSQTWQQIDDFPGLQRDDATSFVIDNIAYCGAGHPSGIPCATDFYALDMDTDTWQSIASLPVGKDRQYAGGFSHNGMGYVFGGHCSGSFLNDLWQYDPLSNSWTEKTAMPATGRSAMVCFVIGDTAYIACGKTATDYAIDEVWAYNLVNDSWIQKTNFPFGKRWWACGTSAGGKGYLMHGKSDLLAYSTGLYEYDPGSDTWSALPDFPMPGRSHSRMIFFNNDLLVLTGWDSLGDSHSDMWRYDLADGVWDQLAPIPGIGRHGGICFGNNTHIYYSTGLDQFNTRLKETWKNINPTVIDEAVSSDLIVYPNPATNFVMLQWNPSQDLNIKNIIVYDLTGRAVMHLESPIETPYLVDVSTLQTGWYSLVIMTEAAVFTQTIGVQ
jgi:N-acetylneuraminic acid mutarotase